MSSAGPSIVLSGLSLARGVRSFLTWAYGRRRSSRGPNGSLSPALGSRTQHFQGWFARSHVQVCHPRQRPTGYTAALRVYPQAARTALSSSALEN